MSRTRTFIYATIIFTRRCCYARATENVLSELRKPHKIY